MPGRVLWWLRDTHKCFLVACLDLHWLVAVLSPLVRLSVSAKVHNAVGLILKPVCTWVSVGDRRSSADILCATELLSMSLVLSSEPSLIDFLDAAEACHICELHVKPASCGHSGLSDQKCGRYTGQWLSDPNAGVKLSGWCQHRSSRVEA